MNMRQRILIAEDNSVMANVVRFNLAKAGFEVVIAENGKIALKQAGEQQFDLIITDQQMPEMGGSEFCQRMRELKGYENVPVILLTAKGLELDLARLRDELGITATLPKPFSPSRLVREVEALLAATT